MEKRDAVAIVHPSQVLVKPHLRDLASSKGKVDVRGYSTFDELALESLKLSGLSAEQLLEMYDMHHVDEIAALARMDEDGLASLSEFRSRVRVVLADLSVSNLSRKTLLRNAFPNAGILFTSDNVSGASAAFRSLGRFSTSASVLPPYVIGGADASSVEVADHSFINSTLESALSAGSFADARASVPGVWAQIFNK